MKRSHVYIRFNANQIGLRIEASMDGEQWRNVEFQKWTEYASPTVAAYGSCLDTERQKAEYLETLKQRGIKTTVVRSP